MSNLEHILKEADQKFDGGSFAESTGLYRAAATIKPDSVTLGNIKLSQYLELLGFIRSLLQQYPKNLELQLTEANVLADMGYASKAVRLYTDALTLSASEQDSQRIRLARLEVAIKCGEYQAFLEDFLALWSASQSKNQQRSLLKIVAGVQDTKFIQTLRTLIAKSTFSEPVKSFFNSKANELHALSLVVSSPGE